MSKILSARALNLKLICNIISNKDSNYNEIQHYVTDKAFYTKYDCCLLLYLLDLIKSNLPIDFKETFLIILYLLNTNF